MKTDTSQLKLIVIVFFYALILPMLFFFAFVMIIGEVFCKYESQTPGLYEEVYQQETHGDGLSHHNQNINRIVIDYK